MPKFNVSQKELSNFSCEALQALAQGFRLAGRYDVAAYIESIAKTKGCVLSQGQVTPQLYMGGV